MAGTYYRSLEWRSRISVAKKGKPRSLNYRLWTSEEVSWLSSAYCHYSIDEICKHLSRSPNSIWLKANELGLKMRRMQIRRNSWPFIRGNPYKEALIEAEKAYIAGILDGEGCVTVSLGHWRLMIVNTYEPLLRWLQVKLPYSTVVQHHFAEGNHRATWEWRLCDNIKIKALLECLLPFLIVKKDKSEEAVKAIWNREREILGDNAIGVNYGHNAKF